MIQFTRHGKTLLAVCGIVVGLVALTGAQALAQGTIGEQPWILLIQGQYRTVTGIDAGRTDPISVWCRAEAAQRSDLTITRPSVGPAVAIALAAEAYAQANFQEVVDLLDTLQVETTPADRVFLDLHLAAAQMEIGYVADAEAALSESVTRARDQLLPVAECFALLTRGRARVRLRQAAESESDLAAAYALAGELRLPRWQGTAAIALSVIARLQMDLELALDWREKALVHYKAAGDLAGQARALHYIATIGIMQGDLTRSHAKLQDALALARAADSSAEEGGILGDMAGINFLLGDFEQALAQYEQAVRLAPNPRRRGMMLINIGSIYDYQRQNADAKEVLTEALELVQSVGDHRTEALARTELGATLCELGDFEAGLAQIDQALAVAREYELPMSEVYALEARGYGLLAQGDLKTAATALAETVDLARHIDYSPYLESALLGAAKVARRQGRQSEAHTYLEEALAEVATVRRRSGGSAAVTSGIVSQALDIYRELIDLLYHRHTEKPGQGLDKRAFAVAQDAKARAFLDLLSEAEFDLRFSAVPGYRGQESEILGRILALEQALDTARQATAPADSLGRLKSDLAAAEDELQLLEARLRAEDPRYADVLYTQPLSLERLQSEVLAPGEVFLEYALGDSASYVWAIDTQGVEFVQLPPRAEIEVLVRDLLPLLSDYNLTGGDPAWLAPAARRLYQVLLDPVADRVALAERLIVSGDGILHYLPFGTLLTADSHAAVCGQLPWLAKTCVVSCTPSASVLAKVRQRRLGRRTAGSWLLVGDPVLSSSQDAGLFARAAGAAGLPSLPYAAHELSALYELAPGEENRVLSGRAATIANLQVLGPDNPYTLVHFATHGLFNEDRPQYSGLVLSPDVRTGDDGFLSVSDVFGLQLACDQVTLSACGSALGHNVSGEGLVGLTRSFMFAGARSVVATLWDVSGEATAALMGEFYAGLIQGRRDRAEILTLAQRRLIDGVVTDPQGDLDWAHPAFWAAFVFNGDGGN